MPDQQRYLDLGRGRWLRRKPRCLREDGPCESMKKDVFEGCASIRCRYQYFEIVLSDAIEEETRLLA